MIFKGLFFTPVLTNTYNIFSAENLSEQDIETKFSSLSLAFKTDRMTLQERLELQHRQRDIAGEM